MTPKYHVALALADALLAGDAGLAGLMRSANHALGAPLPWVRALCRLVRRRAGARQASRHELAGWIAGQRGFSRAWSEDDPRPAIKHYCLQGQRAAEAPPWLAALALPQLASSAELAQWLRVTPGELAWYADRWRDAGPQALRHYRYRWLEKRSGGWRLIEMPKLRLRAIQGRLLRQILNLVPPHPAAHGFRRGHSCATHAALHAGKTVLIKMDLRDFFPSIPAPRVHALFASLGYPEAVAGALARLCTHRTPGAAFEALGVAVPAHSRALLRTPHLPQGAPSSPALANLCAYRLDARLSALAQSLSATYSRYADDLAFSGGPELRRALPRFQAQVAAIAVEEGFRLHPGKTRLMRSGARQQVTGIVVNRHPNLPRREVDALKATLHNCARHGPASQNRCGHADFRAFLAGKLAYLHMLNPQRSMRLRRIFEQIVWPVAAPAAHYPD
ncbi:RNA-directed DNA polymerase [Oxalobacteraceae bacterium GrIS 1.11]